MPTHKPSPTVCSSPIRSGNAAKSVAANLQRCQETADPERSRRLYATRPDRRTAPPRRVILIPSGQMATVARSWSTPSARAPVARHDDGALHHNLFLRLGVLSRQELVNPIRWPHPVSLRFNWRLPDILLDRIRFKMVPAICDSRQLHHRASLTLRCVSALVLPGMVVSPNQTSVPLLILRCRSGSR